MHVAAQRLGSLGARLGQRQQPVLQFHVGQLRYLAGQNHDLPQCPAQSTNLLSRHSEVAQQRDRAGVRHGERPVGVAAGGMPMPVCGRCRWFAGLRWWPRNRGMEPAGRQERDGALTRPARVPPGLQAADRPGAGVHRGPSGQRSPPG
jgi:hypothetical protein